MAITQKIKKRNGEIADFYPEKITIAVQKAFAAVMGDSHDAEAINITRAVVDAIDLKFGGTAFIPSVEDIQDLVENALMQRGFYTVAKSYIIYRYEHEKVREIARAEVVEKIIENALLIEKRDGRTEPFSEEKLARTLARASMGYEDIVAAGNIVGRVRAELYEGMKTKDIQELLIMVVRSFIEKDPAYSWVASRLLLQSLYRQVLGDIDYAHLEDEHKAAFIRSMKRGVEVGQYNPELLSFDLEKMAEALEIKRDHEFKYLGLQTLQANYLSKVHGTKELLETPQIFWMRVSMGCALNEKTPEERERNAIEFYEIMSAMYYMPSSPTLYHAGLLKPQLSSCFLMTVPDDLHAIFKNYSDGAQLLKYAGGLGTDWTPVRATGSLVKTTGVESQGVIPFLKIANDVTISINRSGRRRGAAAVYLEYWHADIEDFMELRKNTGDERRRAHDLNTAVWIPDLFMKRLQEDGYWTLFSPSDVPDLHDLYGRKFEEAYVRYEELAEQGTVPMWKRVRAADLWRKNLTMLFETGHPWITWKDPSNIRSPQDHAGVVHSSNLCTEITLNSSHNETAVCNLGSLNLANFVSDAKFDRDLVARVVPVAMRMLDNVIDVNYYPTEDTKRSNFRHRPVGLGLRGLQDALFKLGLNFDTDEAVRFSDESMEAIAYHAIMASALLAKERGTYETYKGSKWDRGILPQDTIALLEQERGMKVDVPRHETLNWQLVREAVRKFGMRNSNTMANAPTATTANIAGCYPTVEPIYKNIYVKSNMAGDFMIVNEFLVEDLKSLGLWSEEMLETIKYYDGSIQDIDAIPPALKEKYKEVFEMEPQWLIKAAAYRGRWIDMSQSLNIFYGGTSGKALSDIYQYAWNLGLKTTYYLRTLGASRIEKSTVNMAKFGGTSKSDTSRGGVEVMVEETIAVLPRQPHEEPSMMAAIYPEHVEGVESTLMSTTEVATVVEAVAQVEGGQTQLPNIAPAYSPIKVAQTVSSGVPALGGEPLAVKSRPFDSPRQDSGQAAQVVRLRESQTRGDKPKVEQIGEVCESCSA